MVHLLITYRVVMAYYNQLNFRFKSFVNSRCYGLVLVSTGVVFIRVPRDDGVLARSAALFAICSSCGKRWNLQFDLKVNKQVLKRSNIFKNIILSSAKFYAKWLHQLEVHATCYRETRTSERGTVIYAYALCFHDFVEQLNQQPHWTIIR